MHKCLTSLKITDRTADSLRNKGQTCMHGWAKLINNDVLMKYVNGKSSCKYRYGIKRIKYVIENRNKTTNSYQHSVNRNCANERSLVDPC